MELPRLEPLYQKYKDKGLTVVAVEAARDTEGATTALATTLPTRISPRIVRKLTLRTKDLLLSMMVVLNAW